MKKTNHKIYIILFCFFVSCFPDNRELFFKPDTLQVGYCNNDFEIKRLNISIRTIDSEERFKRIKTIDLIDGAKARNEIYLTIENEGYDGYLTKFIPNTEYKIDIRNLDSSSFLYFYTDNNSKIIKVDNEFGCN